jgi:hypothetical protein
MVTVVGCIYLRNGRYLMLDIERASEIMLEIAEKFGYDLEDDADLQQVGLIMVENYLNELGNFSSEDLLACRAHVEAEASSVKTIEK